MRPIVKAKVGSAVTYVDSQGHTVNHVVQEYYADYKETKLPLVGNLGPYCSYCERQLLASDLAVEHIEPKSKNGKETEWADFLIACNVCNGVKKDSVADRDSHWPHLNNTFLSFIYDNTGRIKVNPDLSAQSRAHAQKLLDLIHLQRCPDSSDIPTEMDFRWCKRYETWNKATRQKELYLHRSINEEDVITMAKSSGYWSVWFTVFAGVDVILSRLISDFPGTCASCFDKDNHYAPIERNPGCDDPV